MKIKLPFLIGLLALMALSAQLQAQVYKTAVGARVGYPVAASLKYFLSQSNAVEFYVAARGYGNYRWGSFNGAYLLHRPLDIEGINGLQYYVGFGGSIYFWNYDNRAFRDQYARTSFGIQGYLGLDLALGDLPLNLTADWVPAIFFGNNLYDTRSFGYGYGGIGVRYILAR